MGTHRPNGYSSLLMGLSELFVDTLDEDNPLLPLRPCLAPRRTEPLLPLALLLPWFSASCYFLCTSYSSSVKYNFPSSCIIDGGVSNASSVAFKRPISSVTVSVVGSRRVWIARMIYLNHAGML